MLFYDFPRKLILNLKIHPMIHKGYPKRVYQFLLVVLLALCVLLNHLCNHRISKTCLSLLVGGTFSFMCITQPFVQPSLKTLIHYIVGFLFLYLQWSIQLVFIWFMWFLDIPSLQKVGTICSSLAFPLLCYHMF